MRDLNEENLTEAVLARLNCADERTRTILVKLIKHLHDFIRDLEPTEEEWFKTIDFLTRTGANVYGQKAGVYSAVRCARRFHAR